MRAVSAAGALLLLTGCAAAPLSPLSGPESARLVPPDYYSRPVNRKPRAAAKRPAKPEAQEERGGPSAGPDVGEVVDRMQEIETQLRELRRQLGD